MLKLSYSNLEFQNFPGRTPGPSPSSRGGKGGEEWEGKGKGRREGKDREGTGMGQWREGGEERGVVGRGGHSTWAPPPRDKLWIRPWNQTGFSLRVHTPTCSGWQLLLLPPPSEPAYFFYRLLPVRSGPPKFSQRRTSSDCWCKILDRSDALPVTQPTATTPKHWGNEKKRSERRKHCALAVVGGAKYFTPPQTPSRGRMTAKI